jgi:hypothetical protein
MQVDCLKCRVERVIENSTSIIIENGKSTIHGICYVYETKALMIGET